MRVKLNFDLLKFGNLSCLFRRLLLSGSANSDSSPTATSLENSGAGTRGSKLNGDDITYDIGKAAFGTLTAVTVALITFEFTHLMKPLWELV